MKKLCGPEAAALLPVSNGIIIIKKSVDQKERYAVKYDLFSTETSRITPISKTDFLLNKFGSCFERIASQVNGLYSTNTVILPNGKVLTVDTDGKAAIFNSVGEKIRNFDMRYNNDAPSSIAFCGSKLYAAFSNQNVILQYNPYTLGHQMRFGSPDSDTFQKPISICGHHGRLYICNSKSDKITIFEPDKFNIIDYAEFKDPLIQYVRMHGRELVLLKSGVYLI